MKEIYQQTVEEVLDHVESRESGLTSEQVERSRENCGWNELAEGKKKSILQIFFEQYKDFLVLILIASAVISGMLGDVESAAGAKKIVIFGVTGNRVDHLMANFGLLILAQNQGAEVILVDQYNYMKLISDGTVLKKSEQFGKYVSFFPFGGNVTDLTLEGFKYSLDHYRLTTADSGLTVSNEIVSEKAKVTYQSGTLLMIMSRD